MAVPFLILAITFSIVLIFAGATLAKISKSANDHINNDV